MKRNLLLILFPLLCLCNFAQTTLPNKTVKTEDPDPVQAYTDSLLRVKDSLSIYPQKTSQNDRIRTINDMRLFFPFTYYRGVSKELFSRNAPDNGYNTELMHLYLQRPDLVRMTEKAVMSQQSNIDDIEVPIRHDARFMERVTAKGEEPSTAPIELMIKRPNFWTFKGDYTLQFLQNYVSPNWYKGGESNYAALAALVMQANYNNKQKVKWENQLELKYGMQSSRSDSLHSFKSTEDLIRLTSKLGLQATKRWYYTFQFIGTTQFSHSYKSNDPRVYADFLAPLNLNVSLGMDYTADWLKHRLKGTFHIAPLAYNMKYTRLLDLSERLGIGTDKHVLHDFGSEFTIDLEWKLMESLTWKTRLYGYTTYHRAELEWENTFTFRFNKFISSRLFIYPRFDDGVQPDLHHHYWQIKEFASIGFQYSF